MCNKTQSAHFFFSHLCIYRMTLTKIKDNKRYNDLRSIDCQAASDTDIDRVEEEHHEESNSISCDQSKRVSIQYSIPTIVISDEKCTSTVMPGSTR